MSHFHAIHYSKIATVFRKLTINVRNRDIIKQAIIMDLAEMFKKDNERFDLVKFTDACYDEEDS